jgi:hypothetical protein
MSPHVGCFARIVKWEFPKTLFRLKELGDTRRYEPAAYKCTAVECGARANNPGVFWALVQNAAGNWSPPPGYENLLGENQEVTYTVPTIPAAYYRARVRLQ